MKEVHPVQSTQRTPLRTQDKRPYRKPTLVVHGDVSRITGFLGQGKTDGRPNGRLYRHS